MRSQKVTALLLFLVIGLIGFHPIGLAYESNDRLSVGGVLAGVGQYQDLIDSDGAESKGRGALAFQPELSFTPIRDGELFVKTGFAAGNGLNEISPFFLAPWAADLEDNVQDINGRKRDYLLTAWYKQTFPLGKDHTLGITAGLIDATDYLDTNSYANDEYTQFMNEALVNSPHGFFPSYDLGGALEWDFRHLGLRFVIMNVGENDDGNNFTFFGVQLAYTLKTSLGEGNYRIVIDSTTSDFLDTSGENKEKLSCILFSFDQAFGPIFGGFLRFGWQDDQAAVFCKALYSGGINISGKIWGREGDNVGIGIGFLDGGNLAIDRTLVGEAYVRFALIDPLSLTLDLQYMDDQFVDGGGPRGFIYGARLVAAF